MIGPINPDRFDEMAQDARRLKFLEAYIFSYGQIILHNGCTHLGFPIGLTRGDLASVLDKLMLRHPELCEQITEVVANAKK